MALRAFPTYPIGTPGVAWGDAERVQWRSAQSKKRDYVADVLTFLTEAFKSNVSLAAVAEIVPYGTLDYSDLGQPKYDLVAVRSKSFDQALRTVVVTGGVHGYETSGVHGALQFVAQQFTNFAPKVNLVILPCISPWAYETINRWNPNAIDPNRSFNPDAPGCGEAGLAMAAIRNAAAAGGAVLVHTDLHETTDTDNSEFSPAKFARDGREPDPWSEIPDGFYLVADSERPKQLDFHRAMIDAVKKVTHIAPPDEKNCIIGEPLISEGVVEYPCRKLFLCASQTDAPYVVTTEVYPDSSKTNPQECNDAQVTCVVAAIEYALSQLSK